MRAKLPLARVLVVDDVRDNRELYAEYLAFRGYEVCVASDGQEALDRAAALLPDIILMDLALPILDGSEATRRLKLDRRTKHIPIIVITGHVEPTHRQRAIDAGCDLFLAKPHLPEAIEVAIQRLLRRP